MMELRRPADFGALLSLGLLAVGLCLTPSPLLASDPTDDDLVSELPGTDPPAPAAVATPEAAVEIVGDSVEKAFLKRLAGEFDKVTAAQAVIKQVRHSEIFLETKELAGTLNVSKPGKFLLVYDKGDNSRTYIVDRTVYIYMPDQKQVEKYTLTNESSTVEALNFDLLGFEFDPDEVLEVYEVAVESSVVEDAGTSTTLRFIPRDTNRTMLSVLRLSLRESAGANGGPTLLPSHLSYEETSGDSSSMLLESIDINPALDASIFQPDFPPDVDIVDNP